MVPYVVIGGVDVNGVVRECSDAVEVNEWCNAEEVLRQVGIAKNACILEAGSWY
jgi:hypothetical protein